MMAMRYNTRCAELEKKIIQLMIRIRQVAIRIFLYPYLSANLPKIYPKSRLEIRKIIKTVDFNHSLALYTAPITTARYICIVRTISEMSEKANKYSQTFFCVVRSCLIPARVFLYMLCVARMMGCFFSLNRRSSGSINTADKINIGRNTKCLPGVHRNANAPLAIGRKISKAAIRPTPPIHSPMPEIMAMLSFLHTSFSSEL